MSLELMTYPSSLEMQAFKLLLWPPVACIDNMRVHM
jgi:hypothetical protein